MLVMCVVPAGRWRLLYTAVFLPAPASIWSMALPPLPLVGVPPPPEGPLVEEDAMVAGVETMGKNGGKASMAGHFWVRQKFELIFRKRRRCTF